MKRFLAILILATTLITTVSCKNNNNKTYRPPENTTTTTSDENNQAEPIKNKTFTSNGLMVTLTEDFRKISLPGYTVCYQSESVTVIALKESFSLKEGMKDWTLFEYANRVQVSNHEHSPTVPQKVGDHMVMEYLFFDSIDYTKYHYYTCMYKGTDAFWTIQFICKRDEIAQHKANFIKWADSVRV